MAWRASKFLSYWAALYKGTDAEIAIDPYVAALGKPYRFQHPFFNLGSIADFSFPTERFVFEIDGKSHRGKAAVAKDAERTAKLEKMGWVVARCKNEEAFSEPEKAVKRMWAECVEQRRALVMAKIA